MVEAQLAQEEAQVNHELDAKNLVLHDIKNELKDIDKMHDSGEPVRAFRDNFARAIVELDVPPPEDFSRCV